MPRLLLVLPMLLFALQSQIAFAEQTSAMRQDPTVIRHAVEQFLQTQATGLPGQVIITVGSLDARSYLQACAAPEPFMPNGSRVWGKTTIGVRCTVPAPWIIYISATVKVMADYIVTAAPLSQGQLIQATDLAKIKGDLTSLPAGIITDPSQAIGRTMTSSLKMGTPLRQDALRSQRAVQQGQSVRLVSTGPGFRVASEGQALNNAAEGQVAQARTASGQIISGVAKAGGILEVAY